MLIYHFTTVDNLKLILKSKELKFGNLEHSNDPLEHYYAKSIIEKAIKEFCKNDLEEILLNFRMNISNQQDLYMDGICFSKKLENVHNWAEYGDHGYGVALGFDYDKLKELFKENNLCKYIDLMDVIYSKKLVIENTKKIIDSPSPSYEKGLKLGKLYLRIKQPSYFVENECRIIHLPSKTLTALEIIDNDKKSLLFFWEEKLNAYVLNLDMLYEKGVFKKIIFGCNIATYIVKLLKENYLENLTNIICESSKAVVKNKGEIK